MPLEPTPTTQPQEAAGAIANVNPVVNKEDPTRKGKLQKALNLDQTDLTADEQQELEILSLEFSDIFALDPYKLGCTHITTHSIDKGSHPPI